MLKIKKPFNFLVVLLVLLSLVSCDPIEYSYDYDVLNSTVSSVYLVRFNDQESKELFEKAEDVKDFDISKASVMHVLKDDLQSEFLREFSETKLLRVWRHMDSPSGMGIIILYNDGAFDVVCYEVQFSCRYDTEGHVKDVIGGGGGTALGALVKKYFNFSA